MHGRICRATQYAGLLPARVRYRHPDYNKLETQGWKALGAEMPAADSAAAYAAGFMTATALLHLARIGAGVALGWLGRSRDSTAFARPAF